MKKHSERAESKTRIGRRVLLLIATVITAIAVAVTCALCIDTSKRVAVDKAEQGEVHTSTSATYTTTGKTYNFNVTTGSIANNTAGQLQNDDVLTFTTASSYYGVTLPKGTYTLSCWGAQGGTGQGSSTSSRPAGAYGGYSTGTYKITTATTIYIYVGGKGGDAPSNNTTGSAVSGGYNGGGNSGTNNYGYYKGAGGGGASHIATTTGVLSGLTSAANKAKIIMVAGGGGGAGYSASYSQGKGGGESGSANYPSGGSHNATGGTQTEGGQDKGTHGLRGSAGTFGKGGAGATGSGRSGGGGGGGGYWGGAGGDSGANSACGGGGGGSGYLSSAITDGSMSNGARSGNGQVQIKVDKVNDAPTSQDVTLGTTPYRGAISGGISVTASTLAKDKDYTNITNGAENNVYFTAGSGTYNKDTSPSNNSGVYLDEECTIDAYSNGYLTYSWSGGSTSARTTLTINSVLKMPRNGTHTQTSNTQFTLYTKVRDNYGSNNTMRGVGAAKFYLNVNDYAIAVKAATTTSTYRFGMNTHYTQAEGSNDYSTGTGIYNPSATKANERMTVFIPKTISPTDTTGFTINASDLFSDADTYDQVAFKSLSVVSGYTGYVNASSYYNLSFKTDSNYATGFYPSFTIKPSGVRPSGSPWVVMQILAQSFEKTSKTGMGSTQTTAVYLVFRISNTRPYLGSTAALPTKLPEQVVTLAPGDTARVNLKSFVYDMDDGGTFTAAGNKLKATFAQGANDLKVPTGEFIQVGFDNSVNALATDTKVNPTSNYVGKSAVDTNSYLTGEGTVPTYFNKSLIAANGSNAASTANVTYRYIDSQTIEFTGRAASQNQYRKNGGTDVDTDRKGHFYVLIRLVDPSDVSDTGIWMPIALEVTSEAPKEPTPFANITLNFTDATVDENTRVLQPGSPVSGYLTPLSYIDSNGVLQGIGKISTDYSNDGHVQPIAVDPDGFIYSDPNAAFERANALNDFVFISGASAIHAEATNSFFTVKTHTLYAPTSVFAMIPDSERSKYGISAYENSGLSTFIGLEIEPIRSTNGEYYQFTVDVKDTHMGNDEYATISICVKVDNRPVASRFDPNPDPDSPSAGGPRINALLGRDNQTPRGSYEVNNNLGEGTKVVNYTLEVNDEIQITPYDFAFDYDIDPKLNKLNPTVQNNTTYNTNPLDAGFKTAAEHITGSYSIIHTTEPATAKGEASAVRAQQLTFTFMSSSTAQDAYKNQYNSQYGNYINVQPSSSTVFKSEAGATETFDIPSIRIKGVARTTSAIVQLRFTVTDGYTSVNCFVTVTVLNAAPVLNTEANHPKQNADDVRVRSYYELTAFTETDSKLVPNVQTFTALEVAYDKDGDNPTFIADSNSPKIVAYDSVKNDYFEQVYVDADGKYHGYNNDSGVTPINLTDYVNAQITKNNVGTDVIRLQGLSSTELIDLPIYVRFRVRDGYRAQPQEADLYILIGVVNTNPRFIGDSLLKSIDDDLPYTSNDKYSWLIDYEVKSELKQARYIFNSSELYDGSLHDTNDNIISIPEKNKVYLFDDYDAKQRVILNPSEFADLGSLVGTFDSRITNTTTGEIIGRKYIKETDFAENKYKNAALIYTPMYEKADGNQSNPTNSQLGYLTVNIRFFYKSGNGFKEYASGVASADCEYWAIEILDTRAEGTVRPVQFALSVKDSHYGKTLYDDPSKDDANKSKTTDSQLKVLNFFYDYREPGIMAMHTYYRTDGNAESKVLVSEDGQPAVYLVDQTNITVADFDNIPDDATQTQLRSDYSNADKSEVLEKYQKNTAAEVRQTILGQIKFSDEFKYKYFVRTYLDSGDTVLTYKHFPSANNDQQFRYRPIVVDPESSVKIPMSYIAMPKGAGINTEQEHVTFANVGWGSGTDSLSDGNVLLDGDYNTSKWMGVDGQAKILSNLTISDGTNSYAIEDNPYIKIEYVAQTGNESIFEDKYLNTQRFNLSAPGEPAPFGTTSYREDKYGFEFSKKEGGIRAPGMLTLTLALKTINSEKPGKVEMVDVQINLLDAKPIVKYTNYINNQGVPATNDTVTNVALHMTMSDTSGSKMSLTSVSKDYDAKEKAQGEIYYYDADRSSSAEFVGYSDSMKFYTASVYKDGLTRTETKYILDNAVETVRTTYYGVTNVNQIGEDKTVNPYDYDPNPNYSMFFDVSPSSGSSTSLEFIPKAKTQPNFPANTSAEVKNAYYQRYHLKVDNKDKVYYPFRVLFYDDCRSSAITQGYVFVAEIRIYIDNDEISVNTASIGNKKYSGANDTYKNAPKYSLKLSKSSSFYIDVTSLLKDEDIVLVENSKTFATVSDNEWKSLANSEDQSKKDQSYIKDYLVMPKVEGKISYTNLYRQDNQFASADLPFTMNMGGDKNFTALPYTTLIFKADCAFKDDINLGFEFADSNGATAHIVFEFSYNNEAPTPNSSTFGSSNTVEITMRTGETVYLYASDSTEFGNDEHSGFGSWKNVGQHYTFPYDITQQNTTQQSASEMADEFKFFPSRYGNAKYTGNSLVLASDDAPTTLRITGWPNLSSLGVTDSGLLTVKGELPVKRDDVTNNTTGDLRVAITACGVVDVNIPFTIADGKGATVVVNVRISVQSSAPYVTTTASDLSALGLTPVTGEANTYSFELKYSENQSEASKTISLSQLMLDVDADDVNTLDVYTNMDGSKFSIVNPGESSVVSASVGKDGGKNTVKITAIDFIDLKDAVAKVRFRVTDKHGAVSDYIEFRVTIKPANVSSVVAANRSLPVSIMSYAQYIDVQNAGEPQQVKIVENAGAKMFKDTDVTAPSAAYDVSIYVLLKYSESTKTYNTYTFDAENIGSNILLYSRSGSEIYNNTFDEAALYVRKFFTLSVAEDGKSILFTPNSVSIRSGNTITAVPLYVVVSKRYGDGKTTMPSVGAQMDVSVGNSKLMATEGGADYTLNYGYPMVKGELRNSAFLSFTGSKGDSLTWNLYDVKDRHLGLFYDYDMLNCTAEDGGNESITYIGYDYTVNEVGVAANDTVLRVAVSGTDANQKLTITINRNVVPIQPTADGLENKSTAIDVYVYAVDAVNNTQGVSKKDTDKVVVTKITVNVENDRPEIATTGNVGTCPHCGETTVVQENERLARCSSCGETFKSLDPAQLGYSIVNVAGTGYVMNMSLASGASREIRISDILDDADINMDSYAIVPSNGINSLMSGGTLATSLRAGDEASAFTIKYNSGNSDYKLSTLKSITFTGRSVARGTQGTCTVMFRDSYAGSTTSMLTINITVGNIAPTVKSGVSTNITLMGLSANAKPEAVTDAYKTYSILDFITDANGDNFDASLEANKNKRPTYVYVDNIELYTSAPETAQSNRPDIFGPNLMDTQINPETGLEEQYATVDTVCYLNWLTDDLTHQKFRIEPIPGIYGVQKVVLTVWDSGCDDGLAAGIVDGISYKLTLTITIANPLDNVPQELETKDMVFGITRSIHVQDLLGEDDSKGYEIIDIKEIDTNYLTIIGPNDSGVSTSADGIAIGNWRIYAKVESVSTKVRVTFAAGDVRRDRILPIKIVANNKPVYKNNTTKYNYTKSMLDDKQSRTIKIYPTDWFEDSDAEDVMTFITPITSSQSVKVEAVRSEENGQSYILLKFNRRGESVIKVTLTDLSGKSYTYEVTVNCTDAPELSWWESTVSLIEANWMWFWIIVGAALLFIILLIIIIVVICKKRKMRREIEALLESETELEEEMMRLSSGAAYQSFGYLPPTQQTMMDPGMMLGGGASAPTPNSLQLNAGTGVPTAGTHQPTVNNIPNGNAQQVSRPQQSAPQRPQQNVQTPPVSNDGFNPDDF